MLRYRAMIHGVSAPGLSVRPYFNRYTEDAIDLCDASSFSTPVKATLHDRHGIEEVTDNGKEPLGKRYRYSAQA
jgi:hypothetical protein